MYAPRTVATVDYDVRAIHCATATPIEHTSHHALASQAPLKTDQSIRETDSTIQMTFILELFYFLQLAFFVSRGSLGRQLSQNRAARRLRTSRRGDSHTRIPAFVKKTITLVARQVTVERKRVAKINSRRKVDLQTRIGSGSWFPLGKSSCALQAYATRRAKT